MKKRLAVLLITAIVLLGAAMLCHAAETPTVYVDDSGNDSAAGTADAPLATLYAAFRALPSGGRVVVRGTLHTGAVVLPAADGLITLTGADESAVLSMGGNITFQSAVELENLHIAVTVKNLVFLCGGNYARFGEGLTVTTSGSGVTLPGITAGSSGAVSPNGTYLEICSGSWYRIRGGARGTSSAAQSGDVCLVIRGGEFNSTFDLGGDSAIAGNAYLYIFGGRFKASVNGASAAATEGNVYITIAGGEFLSTVCATRGGNIGGDATWNLLADVAKTVTLGSGTVSGSATVKRKAGVSAASSGYTVVELSAAEAAAIEAADAAAIEAARAAKLPSTVDKFGERDTSSCGSAQKTDLSVSDRLGDVNDDGKLSLLDVLNTLRMAGSGTYSERADTALSGRVTLRDAAAICRAVVGEEDGVTPAIEANEISDTLSLYGGAAVKNGEITRGFAFGSTEKSVYTLYTDADLGGKAKVGLYFSCDLADGLDKVSGSYFELDAAAQTASVYRIIGGQYRLVGARTVELFGTRIRLEVEYADGAATLYLIDNALDPDPYPLFNLVLEAAGKSCGVYAEDASAALPVIGGFTPHAGATYTNVIFEQFTDPEVFFKGGRYYIYGTQSSTQNYGVKCYSTANFRIWKDEGYALAAGNAFGDGVFKAANIVEYGGDYYLFYMAKSNELGTSVTAYATAKSPTGPFANETKQPLTGDLDFIGGQPFVDTDGQAYLVYTRTTGGNKLYGAKLTLADGKAAVDLSTEKLLLTATEPWENAKASVVECGYIVRHGNLYYLLYSGGNYNSTYGTGYATAKSPLGPYTKYEKNPILVSNDQAFGVGAATVFPSPDGTEHFIAYLRNFSPTVTRPLCTCVDRIKFVKNPKGGDDLLCVYGPTVTPQPLPSGLGKASIADGQRARFIW